MTRVAFTILGEPASKANSREIATIGRRENRRTIVRKSDKALNYEEAALRQIPAWARLRLEGDLCVTLRIYYASRRPDLDESVVLDVLQDRWARPRNSDGSTGERLLAQAGVYRNDRQVREKHVFWGLDRDNPRTEIEVVAMDGQGDLLGGVA